MKKICLYCKKRLIQRDNEYDYLFLKRKFCNHKCSTSIYKGKEKSEITKEKLSQKLKGHPNFNIELKGCFKKGEHYNLNEIHPLWKGVQASYSSIHKWVRRKKGKAKSCVDCGASIKNKKFEWSNIDHKYLRKLDDYISRCKQCHQKYDYAR